MTEFCKRATVERVFRNYEGIEALCCKMLSNFTIGDPKINQFNERLQTGEKSPVCNICWKREDQGLQSWRQQGNKIYHDYHIHKKMELMFDNTCDSKCIYCSRIYSSAWDQEIKSSRFDVPSNALGLHVQSMKENKTDTILEYIKQAGKEIPIDKYAEIVLLGGEPLLTSINKKGLLETCIEKFYEDTPIEKKLLLVLQTNANTPEILLNKTIKKLKEYKILYPYMDLAVSVSAESTGKNYEYVRFGSNYNRFVTNVETWMKEGVFVSSNMSINCVTLNELRNYFELFVELCKKNKKTTILAANLVFDPVELSIGILDKSFEKYIDEGIVYLNDNKMWIENVDEILTNLAEYKKFLGSELKELKNTKKTLNYFKLQRGIDIKDVNQELYEYLIKN